MNFYLEIYMIIPIELICANIYLETLANMNLIYLS